MKKVYPGLAEVDRALTYHLGHYEVDFPDGALGFQLHARLCTDTSCLCDNLSIDWLAGDRTTHSWYTAEHEWQDAQHKPLPDELTGVFNIVEKTETFQERYSHLVFLRRRQVLQELGRLEGSFTVNLPADLLDEEADPVKQTLGQVRPGAKGGKSLPYAIEFCGDAECFCNNLFVAVIDGAETTSFCVDPKNKWSAMAGTAESTRLLERIQPRLSKSDIFGRQLSFLRTERLLHNYHRFVTRYQETHRVGI